MKAGNDCPQSGCEAARIGVAATAVRNANVFIGHSGLATGNFMVEWALDRCRG